MTSARDPGGPVDRDALVAAVLALVRRKGFPGVTMRGLAAELGLSPMAAYHYVRTKDELISLAVDAVLCEVQTPDPASGSWDERLAALHRNYRSVHETYPGAVSAQLWRTFTPRGRVLANYVLDCLREAGFRGRELASAYAVLHSYFFGRLWLEQSQRDHPVPPPADPEARPLDTFRSEGGTEAFDAWGLDVVLAGLRAQLAPVR